MVVMKRGFTVFHRQSSLGHRWPLVWLLLLGIVCNFGVWQPWFSLSGAGDQSARAGVAWANSSYRDLQQEKSKLDRKRQTYRAQRNASIQKARAVESRLLQKQQELSQARYSLAKQEVALGMTRNRLNDLEKELDKTIGETARLREASRQRIRQLYMGDRLNMLNMLLEVGDLASLLDRFYYQQRLVEQDKTLLSEYKSKKALLDQQKQALVAQRAELARNISNIQNLQQNIALKMNEEQKLRSRYWNDAKYYERLEKQLLAESAAITRQLRAMGSRRVTGSTGQFSWPVRGRLTSRFGYRTHPIHRKTIRHTGLDIAAATGTPVVAADGGQVVFAGWRGGYGKAIIINHGNRGGAGAGYATLYGHLSSIRVSTGQSVSKGMVIGGVGSTGYSTGPHLHFEVRVNGAPVDPLGYL